MRVVQRVLVAVLLVIATFTVNAGARAQEPDGIAASGTVTVGGSYSASVTAAPGNTLPPNGSYQAAVAFTSSSAITSLDPATLSGTFSSSGSYTARVSASGVPDFDAVGSFTVTGSFASGGYTVDGSATLSAPDAGSVAFNGSGSYNLGAATVTANGTYTGDLQTAEFGAARVSGDYNGSGAVVLSQQPSPPQPVSLQAIRFQIPLPTNLLGGIATTAVTGPVAAATLATRAPVATPSGTFAAPPTFAAGGQSLVVFNGGTTDQLEAAALAAGASGVWAQDAGGRYQLLIVRGPAFANAAFRSAFPQGFTAATGVTLTR